MLLRQRRSRTRAGRICTDFAAPNSQTQILRGIHRSRWFIRACDVLVVPAMVGRTVLPDRSGPHRAVHILAHSIVRELRTQGYELRDLIDLAGELLGAACDSIRSESRSESRGDPDDPDSPSSSR
jgi:hypothetical protein